MITITEILDRSVQGMTRPFLCRADDGLLYHVKGRYAGQRSLCCEWVAGCLAQSVLDGLSIGVPVMTIAEVPRALIEGSARADARDLGSGWVFASLRVEGAQELSWSAAQAWPEHKKAAVLLLDLWIQNEDRSLSTQGGNPNVLMTQVPPSSDQPRREMPWAYDFNLAFDDRFDRARFFDAHVFGGMVRQWPQGFPEAMEFRLRLALDRVPDLFAELPPEWLYLDGDDSLPVQLDERRVSSVLRLPFTEPDAFWKLP